MPTYNYLLGPNFQAEDESGKPLVGGYVEVYLHNTTTQYVTKKDFNGTNNEFRVVLNSLGMAVIIADVANAYDVYCYDRFGSLKWSRMAVNCTDTTVITFPFKTSALIANKYDTHYVSGTDAGTGLSDGDFLFAERAKTGENIWIGDDHKIYCNKGWYHFDFTILIFVNPIDYTHNGGTQPRIDTIHLSAGGYGASVDADLDRCATAPYKTSVNISGDFYASFDGYNVGANIAGLGYSAYAHVDNMCVHKIEG